MITVKYSKLYYSRFLSHLDLQTIINRALKRAGFIVNYSQGFNPHPILKMSPPIPLGIKSSAEYFTADLLVQNKEYFLDKLQATLPEGIKLNAFWTTETQPRIAALSVNTGYSFKNLDKYVVKKILEEEQSIACEFNSVPEGLKILEDLGGGLFIVLPSGKNNIRIDTFISFLREKFSLHQTVIDVEKTILFLSYDNEIVNADKYLDFLSKKSLF